jgi:hypothetical protein
LQLIAIFAAAWLVGTALAPAHLHQGASKFARAALLVPRAYGAPGTSYDTNPYSSTGSSSQFGGGARQQQQGSTALASVDQGSAALKAKEQPKMVAVRFWLKFHVDYGQSIRIIGGHDAMGEYLACRTAELFSMLLQRCAASAPAVVSGQTVRISSIIVVPDLVALQLHVRALHARIAWGSVHVC